MWLRRELTRHDLFPFIKYSTKPARLEPERAPSKINIFEATFMGAPSLSQGLIQR